MTGLMFLGCSLFSGLIMQKIIDLKLVTHSPVFGTCFIHQFMAPQTGVSRLVPETMTYFSTSGN